MHSLSPNTRPRRYWSRLASRKILRHLQHLFLHQGPSSVLMVSVYFVFYHSYRSFNRFSFSILLHRYCIMFSKMIKAVPLHLVCHIASSSILQARLMFFINRACTFPPAQRLKLLPNHSLCKPTHPHVWYVRWYTIPPSFPQPSQMLHLLLSPR